MNSRMAFRFVVVITVTAFRVGAVVDAQTPSSSRAASIDPRAIHVLEAMDAAFSQAQGFVATYRSETWRPNGQPAGVETTTLRLGRPNVYYMETTTSRSAQRRILTSNGTKRFSVSTGRESYCSTADVAPLNDSREVDSFNPLYWSFYNLGEWQIRSAMLGHWVTKWRLNDPGLRSVKYVGRESLAGIPVDVIEWTYKIGYNRADDDPLYTSRLSIALDHFVRRIETTSNSQNEYDGRRIVETITDIRVMPKPLSEEFRFEPPSGVACTQVNPEDAYTTGRFADLPVGSQAPDFELSTSRGDPFHLSKFLARYKVVLMNFWGYG